MEPLIVNISKSRTLHLPKAMLDRYGISDKAEITLDEQGIMVRPVKESSVPRAGWDLAMKDMHRNGDDRLLMDDVFGDEDFEAWQ
jgi:antitoxin MazE